MSALFSKEDVFTVDPNKNYAEELVGEGKRFVDVPTLARSKVEGDAHAKRLEGELKELREELNKRLTVEEVLTKITQAKQAAPNPVTNPNEENPAPTPTKDELDKLVSDLVSKRVNESEAERTAKSNFDTVVTSLQKAWGDDFRAKLVTKANELGLGQEWLTQLAGSQPKAFLSLVGVTEAKPQQALPFGVSPTGINTAALTANAHRGEKTASYYEKIRLSDPARYFSKEIQQEQYNQAMKLGEAYFDL